MKTWQPMKVIVIGNVTDVVMGGGKHSAPDGGDKGGWEWFSWIW